MIRIKHLFKHKMLAASMIAAASIVTVTTVSRAADDLKLRPGVSFTQDLDSGFPIVASNMDDCRCDGGSPALIFFGASGDLNTNRQAKRVVDIYHKVNPKEIKFVVIDVDHPVNDDAKKMIKNYYRGYIPFEVVLDKSGKVSWSQIGEVEIGILKAQIDKVL